MSTFTSIASLRYASLADAVSLNPQPLPPKAVSAIATSVLDKVALNPQPLPPKETASPQLIKASVLDAVALNPQPLPPKDDDRLPISRLLRSLDEVSLNPQPLPPKALFNPLAEVALNPQPLPPKDDDRMPIGLGKFNGSALNPQPLPPKALNLLDLDAAGASRKMQMKANQQYMEAKTLENAAAKDEDWSKQSAGHRDAIRDAIVDLLRKMSEIKGTY